MPSTVALSGVDPRVERLRTIASPWAGFAARVIAGMLWLANTDWKRPPDFGRPSRGLWLFTNHGIDHEVFGPFRWMLEKIVVPNFEVFGWLTLTVEVLLAALLLSGTWTRFAGALGVAQAIAITLSVLNTPGEYNWAYYMMIALHLGIVAYGAGPWSVDAMIERARAGDADGVARSVRAGCIGLLAVLASVGAVLAWRTRDADFAISKHGLRYFQAIATGNQALRGTVLLGLTLVAVGVLVFAVGRTAAARSVGLALAVLAVVNLVTYGTKVNVFGGAPSTSALLLVAASFLVNAERSRRRLARTLSAGGVS